MNRIRAFDPSPGAQARLAQAPDERLKIWAARVLEVPAEAAPGTVVETGAQGLVVACGNGRLAIDSLQRAGGRRMAAGAFLAGYPIKPGDRFVIAA
jgi:methionyl-tRNA formyltransferase